jgi:enoyl-CoA hydratase/carnithine racemase
MSEQPRVTVELRDHVADVKLNRPEKINALDPAMFAGLRQAALELEAEPQVRAVVLSGAGRGFCAGLDLESIAGMHDRDDAGATAGNLARRDGGSIANWAQQAAWLWHELPVPVIAAVHGVALGGGAQIALGADIRIVAPDARISILEIRWGLVPDMTGTALLPRLVGLDVAKELTWTGRMVEGEEAVRLGLATRVEGDPHGAAMALAAEIAGRNPDAIRAGKALLNQSGLVPVEQQLLDESKEMGALIGSANQAEAVKAYFEKRPAVFSDAG